MTRTSLLDRQICAGLAAALAGLLLAGCGEGGGVAASGGAGAGGASPVATTTVSVTPSLGQVFAGTVRVIAPGGGGEEVSELARSKTKEDGSADLDVPADAEGPYIVEVSGNDEASYYDEGTDETVPLGEDDVIRAVVLDLPESGIGVTPLTELACRHLEAQYGKLALMTREQLRELFTSGAVEAAYARVRSELAPELGDTHLIAVPAVVGSAADLAALGTTTADLYALKLAALARVGTRDGSVARPALAIMAELGEDLADGMFDGKRDDTPLVPVTFDVTTFAAQLEDAAQQLATNPELKSLVGSFENYVSSFIAALGSTGSGETGGDTGGDGGTLPEIIVLPTPGDLLKTWSATYNGNWQVERLEAWIKVPTFSYPFYKWVRDPVTEEALRLAMLVKTFTGSGCNWVVGTQNVQFGGLTIPFADAYAVASAGDARSYTLPVNLTVLDLGVSATTTMNTQGTLPTRIALDYHYKGLLKELRYTGACSFTYKS